MPGNNLTTLHGRTGADTLNGDVGPDYMIGLGGNDYLIGAGGDDKLDGGAGDDILDAGQTGESMLTGGAGDDTLIVVLGDDELDGGDGDDTASYATAHIGLTVNLADTTQNTEEAKNDSFTSIENLIGSKWDDTLVGDSNANNLDGNAGTDNLDGRGGDDYLTGGPGDDVLQGKDGSDTLVGEAGIDTASYASSSSAVTVNLNTGAASGGSAEGDELFKIEKLIGSAHADTLTGDGTGSIIEGAAGGDTLTGGSGGNDILPYASSNAAVNINLSTNPVIGGHAASDTISGFTNVIGSAHADTLTSGASDNFMEGGAGGDTINPGGGTDTLSYASSGAGVTIVIATSAASRGHAQGDTFNTIENVTGSDHGDVLTGDGSANTLIGGAGDDALDGGDGQDVASYASAPSGVTVNLSDTSENTRDADGDTYTNIEAVLGSAYRDTLTGTSAGELLLGGAGNDRLSGGGSDILSGRPGNDRLSGGGGTDTFRFFAGFGHDTITDRQGGENIWLCIDGANFSINNTGQTSKVTITGPDGNVIGAITFPDCHLPGGTISVSDADGSSCRSSCEHLQPPELVKAEALRVWWISGTPQFSGTGSESRVFFRVNTNIPASSNCTIAGITAAGLNPSGLDCPARTLVSLTPLSGTFGDDVTVTATATAGTQTAQPMTQTFDYGGHNPATTAMSAGDGRIGVAGRDGGPFVAGTAVNGYKVEHRLLGESGAWTSSGTLGASTAARSLSRLTNGSTYDVRVAIPNNANDTDDGTHWWDVWTYDLVTPEADKAALPKAIRPFSLTADSTYVSKTHVVGAASPQITGLTSSTEYTVQIRAHNANSPGPWSTRKITTGS